MKHHLSRDHDTIKRRPDITKLKDVIPGNKFINLSEGLNNTLDYYNKRY